VILEQILIFSPPTRTVKESVHDRAGLNNNMADSRRSSQKPIVTQEQLKKKLEVSNFDPNAILRGAQLTVVGGWSTSSWSSYNPLLTISQL
jgi:hypothetical protein